MNQQQPQPLVAHNINVKKLIATLREFDCPYVDVMVADEFTVQIRMSQYDGGDMKGEINLNDLIV